jgi:riboflavin kinase / FMN adenylyltransferase
MALKIPPPLNTILAIGNFDGVHLGHQAVLTRASQHAVEQNTHASALTFEPHPRQYFKPHEPLFRLTPKAIKVSLLQAYGMAHTHVLAFDEPFATLSADDFMKQILHERLAVKGVVIGHDFHFGAHRGGTPETLQHWCQTRNITCDIVAPVGDESSLLISSTRIRQALSEGNIALANTLLGYVWRICGTVIHGEKRGRDLGFPTANIALDPACQLKHGIYAVRVHVKGDAKGEARLWHGAASFGRRPTFDNGAPLLEIYVLDFSGDLYGQVLQVEFVAFIREEARFDTLETLITQMHQDVAQVRSHLSYEQHTS